MNVVNELIEYHSKGPWNIYFKVETTRSLRKAIMDLALSKKKFILEMLSPGNPIEAWAVPTLFSHATASKASSLLANEAAKYGKPDFKKSDKETQDLMTYICSYMIAADNELKQARTRYNKAQDVEPLADWEAELLYGDDMLSELRKNGWLKISNDIYRKS